VQDIGILLGLRLILLRLYICVYAYVWFLRKLENFAARWVAGSAGHAAVRLDKEGTKYAERGKGADILTNAFQSTSQHE
jgi:hypothetical protein